MKKLLPILALICLTLSLFACGGETPDNNEPSWDGTIFSPEVDVAVVRGGEISAGEMKAYGDIADALFALRGKTPMRLIDSIEQVTPEIAIGKTTRAASSVALAMLDGADNPDGISYVIAYRDGVLAVVASNDESYSLAVEYIKTVLFTSTTLKLPPSYALEVDMSAEEYRDEMMEPIIAEEIKKYEERWARLEAESSPEIAAAFKKLYDFYGTDVIYWFADLWDSDNGGFYYANSARDYKGFLPDLESTSQTLSFLRASGIASYYGNSLSKALPEWMQEKMLKFVWDCADPDGYYYHPQWGKNIGSSRRARDLDNAIGITDCFGGKYRYPTAREQMAAGKSTSYIIEKSLTMPLCGSTASAVSAVIPTASAADCLDSPENMIAWLDSMNFKADSHNNGHAVSCLAAEIVAKGYGELVCNYFTNLLEEVQEELRDTAEAEALAKDPNLTSAEIAEIRKNAENGLWQTTVDYTSLSGLYKICRIYNFASIDFPAQYAMAAVRSSLEAMKQDTDPTFIIHVFNPWAGLNTLMSNMRSTNNRAKARGDGEIHNMDEAYSLVRADAPALIADTLEKLALFRKPDGSFSYYQKVSAATTQGTLVSMGLEEGDVNSTMIGITSITSAMFSTMNLTRPAILHLGHLEEFLDIVENSETVEKIDLDTDITYNFDDGEMPPLMSLTSTNGEAEIVDDPKSTDRGKVLSFSKGAGSGANIQFSVPSTVGGMTSFVYEADYCITNAADVNGIDDYQITINGPGGNLYMFTFAYGAGKTVTVCDDSSTADGRVNRFADTEKEKWFNLRIEAYLLEDESVKFKLYLDGTLIGVSDNFYGSHENGAEAKFGFVEVKIYAMMRTDATLLIDNIHTASYNDVPFVDESTGGGESKSTAVKYDFESDNTEYRATVNNKNSSHGVALDPKNSSNHALHITKSDTVMGTNDHYSFAAPEYRGDDVSHIRVSFDIYFDSADVRGATASEAGKDWTALNCNMFQLTLGEIGAGANEALYCLMLKYEGDGIVIGDSNTTGAPAGKTADFNYYGDNGLKLSLDTWHTVTVDIIRGDSADEFLATVTLDGNKTVTSKNYFNAAVSDTKIPNKFFNYFYIRPLARAAFDMYIDDVNVEHIVAE